MSSNQLASLQDLVDQLIHLTDRLEQSVAATEADGEEWEHLLDERENVIEHMTVLLQSGAAFTDAQKEGLRQVHLSTQRLVPLMTAKKEAVQKQIANLNKAKTANQQYNGGYGYTPYGAFFDKKK